VSYWDPDHHGRTFAIIEAIFGVALCILLFRRFRALWIRAGLVLLALAYIAVPVYFTLALGGST
ncbi:MAG: cobalamin biosynthesis protein CobQ, partial [Pseudomonadota bacterium]